MAFYGIPAKVQPPTMPTGPWEVNTQCAQATGLAALLDIERRRVWWRGQWFPLTMGGAPGQGIVSLPGVGGVATNAIAASGWLYTGLNVLPNPIGVSTPATIHTWGTSSVVTTADKQLVSLIGGANARQSGGYIGSTSQTSANFQCFAKTTGAATFTGRLSNVAPIANTVYAMTFIDRIDTFPDIYINGALNNGATSNDNGGNRVSPIDTLCFGASNSAGGTPINGPLGYCAIWDRRLGANEIQDLVNPVHRWNLLWQKKTLYFDISPPANQDVPPSQYARPKYITLNEFSPQAQGLVAWLPSVDGALVRAVTPSKSMTFSFSLAGRQTNQPSTVVRRDDWINQDPRPIPPESQPSDFGLVPRSFKDMSPAPGNVRSVYLFNTLVDVSGLTDATFVYWIFPLLQPFTDAGYWTQYQGTTAGMTNQSVIFLGSPTQTLTFTSDPHLQGRWQMITVSRTLAGITVWRDQEIVQSGLSAGDSLLTNAGDTYMLIGGINDQSVGGANGVNALWADFRVYNRAWTQTDVNYAYNPATRWDYYWQPRYKPYEDIPLGPPPPVTTFLSRLSTLGAG